MVITFGVSLIVGEIRKSIGMVLSYSVRVATLNLSRRTRYLDGRVEVSIGGLSHTAGQHALADRRYATK